MNKITRSAWSRLKRGFTLVELVIVIAVIAVLAAVLVPTFITVIDNANNSADLQLTASANTILSTDLSADSTATVENLRKLLKDNGITDLTTKQKDNVILYNKEAKKFELKKLNDKTAIGVKDPEASAGTAKTVAADNGDLLVDFAAYCPEEVFAGYILVSTGGNPLSEGLYKLHNWETTPTESSDILKNLNENVKTALATIVPKTLYVAKDGKMFRLDYEDGTLSVNSAPSEAVSNVVFHEECTTIKLSDLANNLKETESLIVTLPETLESVTTNASAGSLAGVTLAGNTDIVKLPENDASGVGVSNKSVSELKDLLNDEDNLKLAYQNEFYVSATQTGDYYYSDLQAALNIANKSADLLGTTAYKNVILADKTYTVENAITIPANVSLILPYYDYEQDGQHKYYSGIGFSEKTENVGSGKFKGETSIIDDEYFSRDGKTYKQCEITFNNNVTIAKGGKLEIGAVTSYKDQYYQGHVSSYYAQANIAENKTITVNGTLDSFGYIKGKGKVVANNGAEVTEPFIVTDYAGGSNCASLFLKKQSPFMRYAMVNIQSSLTINYGAKLFAYCNLWALSQYNTTKAVVIGYGDKASKTKGLITLEKDSYVECEYLYNSSIAVSDSAVKNNLKSDIGKTKVIINGDARTESLSIKVYGMDIPTSSVLFPVPYNFDFIINTGNFRIINQYIILPGASVQVNSDAQLTVTQDSTFYVADYLYQSDHLDNKKYPTAQQLNNETTKLSTSGTLIVNGTMEIETGAHVGGIVRSTEANAKLNIANDVDVSGKFTLGYKQKTAKDNSCVCDFPLRIASGTEIINAEPNTQYQSSGTKKQYSISKTITAEEEAKTYSYTLTLDSYQWTKQTA